MGRVGMGCRFWLAALPVLVLLAGCGATGAGQEVHATGAAAEPEVPADQADLHAEALRDAAVILQGMERVRAGNSFAEHAAP